MATDEPTRPTDPEGVARRLGDAGVSVVALPFVDSAAIVRVKTIPLARFAEVARSGVGLSILFNVAMSDDQFALVDGYIDGPSGDLRLRPDPAATVPLAALPGWAWAPVDQYTQEGEPFAACPRAFVRATGERLDVPKRSSTEPSGSVEHSVGAERGSQGASTWKELVAMRLEGDCVPSLHCPGCVAGGGDNHRSS